MPVTTEMIKELRRLTNAGVMDCKKALDETDGDMEGAVERLRVKSLAVAAKKADRTVADGRIEAYVHTGDRLATLVEVNCETDFVARTTEFRTLCHEMALQVAAANPKWVARGDVPAEVLEAETEMYRAEIMEQNKPEQIVERIVEGKLAKFCQETCLLDQAFIKDDSKTIQQLLTEAIAQLGENIVIKRFARFEIGRE